MKARHLIDQLFEAEGDAAPKGGEQATVSVQITGNPKQIQKALKQLAKEKPAGVKVKSGGEEIKPDTDVKVDGKKDDKGGDKKPAPKSDKKPADDKKADKKGDDKKGEDDKE